MSYEWRERWRKQYKRHIRSKAWRATKARLLHERGGRCARCGRPPPLSLHHKTYERLGRERDDDLELVCTACHPIADMQRAAYNRARAVERRHRRQGAGQLHLF
jgi:5-methylcytosine-specific restriction endonuclease McrA